MSSTSCEHHFVIHIFHQDLYSTVLNVTKLPNPWKQMIIKKHGRMNNVRIKSRTQTTVQPFINYRDPILTQVISNDFRQLLRIVCDTEIVKPSYRCNIYLAKWEMCNSVTSWGKALACPYQQEPGWRHIYDSVQIAVDPEGVIAVFSRDRIYNRELRIRNTQIVIGWIEDRT